MDSQTFDRLTRLLGRPGTRRRTLGGLLGIGVLWNGSADAKEQRDRAKRRRVQAAAQPGLRDCPNPKPGQNLTKCDFFGRDLRGISFGGANLTGSDFEFANLCDSSLRGANLSRVDFTDAFVFRSDLRGTNLSTANLDGTRFCQTIMPNGKINNTNCPRDTEVCCFDSECDDIFGFPAVCEVRTNFCCVPKGTDINGFPGFICCSGDKIGTVCR